MTEQIKKKRVKLKKKSPNVEVHPEILDEPYKLTVQQEEMFEETLDNDKHVAFTFGRMNPPTIGHQKVVDKVKEVAKAHGADAKVFLSRTQDGKKNPLPYERKHTLAHKAFGEVMSKEGDGTLFGTMKHLSKTHAHAHIIVGHDRVEEMKQRLPQYNGKEYHFKSITVHSAGTRDPDADDATGMSASKMRAHALAGNESEFKKGLPKPLHSEHKQIMKDIVDNTKAVKLKKVK